MTEQDSRVEECRYCGGPVFLSLDGWETTEDTNHVWHTGCKDD